MAFQKLLCIFLAVVQLFAGYSKDSSLQTTAAEESMQTESNVEVQLSLLMRLMNTWREDEGEYETYYYTVTDLDQNGRLEITSAIMQGSGLFTYGTMYEVNESLSGLTACWDAEYNSLPDIIVSSVSAAYDSVSGCYDYLFTDGIRNGYMDSYLSIEVVRLQGSALTHTTLAYSHTTQSSVSVTTYFIPSGDDFVECTESEYDSIIPNYQAERQGFTANFEWFTFDSEVNEAILTSSYEVFQASLDALTQ